MVLTGRIGLDGEMFSEFLGIILEFNLQFLFYNFSLDTEPFFPILRILQHIPDKSLADDFFPVQASGIQKSIVNVLKNIVHHPALLIIHRLVISKGTRDVLDGLVINVVIHLISQLSLSPACRECD